MNERDRARKEVKSTTGEKWIALKKYKSLRNQVTSEIRKDVQNENGKRIEAANNESEYWNIVNNITKPQNETKWKLDDGETVTENEKVLTYEI